MNHVLVMLILCQRTLWKDVRRCPRDDKRERRVGRYSEKTCKSLRFCEQSRDAVHCMWWVERQKYLRSLDRSLVLFSVRPSRTSGNQRKRSLFGNSSAGGWESSPVFQGKCIPDMVISIRSSNPSCESFPVHAHAQLEPSSDPHGRKYKDR